MAEKRMFAKTIVDSDAFLDMPLSAQCLYFHLNMRADDEGFVNSPKRIQRLIGASEDDLKLLVAKSFVLLFESGVIVIKHWRINNYLRLDRTKPTQYQEERSLLTVKDNGAYTFGVPSDNQLLAVGTPRLDKNRLDKNRLDKSIGTKTKRFVPPTLDEVIAYVKERGNKVDPNKFYDYYTAADWKDSKGQQVRNWKQKCITWESHRSEPVQKMPDFENKTAQTKKEPQMTPEEAKEWYDNLIQELTNGK